MFKYVIEGGGDLNGNIRIYGSKNSALTLMPAAILTNQKVSFTNLPHVQDIVSMAEMFQDIGADISMEQGTTAQYPKLTLQFEKNIKTVGDYNFVSKMRASILILGPLLARFGHAEVSLPGGCAIGARPVDLHIYAMEALGAKIEISDGYLKAKIINGNKLKGGKIIFPKVTVGGTENALMAATLAEGFTTIENAAKEPEIIDLINLLNQMGAKISGQGTNTLIIEGVENLHGTEYHVRSDRIQAFTYAIISAATGFGIDISGANLEDFIGTFNAFDQIGIALEEKNGIISFKQKFDILKQVNVETEPTPGFPTDCQAQLMALMTCVSGESIISENIFENRMMHVPELIRMGAKIELNKNTAIIKGIMGLSGAQVMATDLRASASLVIAALMAKGETQIRRVYHIDRGYDFLPAKLEACGAKIRKVRE